MSEADDEINLLDYLIVILKRKKMILVITVAAAVLSAAVSLVMTPVYRAETAILPPQQSGTGAASMLMSRLSPGAEGLLGGPLGLKDPGDIYVGIIKSRTVLDRIVDRFGLMELYEEKLRADARRRLEESLSVESNKEGIIVLSVEDEDPEVAAGMANAFVEELKAITQDLAVTEASRRRLFFEKQLEDIKESLIGAEESLQGFQEETGAIKMDKQASAVIESMAQLKAHISAKEVELKVMRTYATERNPDLKRIREEIRGMKEQLFRLEKESGGDEHDPLMPTERMPSLGTDYIRKVRDLKYYETLFELMAKQYEAAKLDEASDATLIQVLDEAITPEKKARPKVRKIVMLFTLAGLFVAILAAFLAEYIESASGRPDGRERLDALKRHFWFR
jgi:uncharacterized protein involved in exopolysaccharide biosynthesis